MLSDKTQGRLFDLANRDRREVNQKSRPSPPVFDGATFEPKLDQIRLTGSLARVFNCMSDGRWRTLAEIRAHDFVNGSSEAGISARLRDLRKEKFGAHKVPRRRRGDPKDGVWEYRLEVNKP